MFSLPPKTVMKITVDENMVGVYLISLRLHINSLVFVGRKCKNQHKHLKGTLSVYSGPKRDTDVGFYFYRTS